MTCDQAFTRYLSLDKGQMVPFSVTLHALACPECRTAIRKLTEAERLASKPLSIRPAPSEVSDPVLAAALSRIAGSGLAYVARPDERHVSMSRWLVAGIALAMGFTAVPFSFVGDWAFLTFGNAYTIPFYILCGIAVTAYCGMFIGTNVDFFVKKLGLGAA